MHERVRWLPTATRPRAERPARSCSSSGGARPSRRLESMSARTVWTFRRMSSDAWFREVGGLLTSQERKSSAKPFNARLRGSRGMSARHAAIQLRLLDRSLAGKAPTFWEPTWLRDLVRNVPFGVSWSSSLRVFAFRRCPPNAAESAARCTTHMARRLIRRRQRVVFEFRDQRLHVRGQDDAPNHFRPQRNRRLGHHLGGQRDVV